MPDLSGIGRNAVEMQQRHKCFETGIGRPRSGGFDTHGALQGDGASGVRLGEQWLLA